MVEEKSKKIIYLEKILKMMSVLILKKYKPRIIGITGSVGKTSAKEAIFTVLKGQFDIRRNEKNYNNEIGLPLTIIGAETGGNSLLKWVIIFAKALGMYILKVKYPKILVLELAADRPGDMKYLVDFIQPEFGIITDISGSHLEFFKSLESITKEKGYLVRNLKEGGTAILNIDNPQLKKIKEQIKSTILTFGFSEEADIRATDIFYNYSKNEESGQSEIKGLSFKLNYRGTSIPMRLNNVLAGHSVYAALSAVAAGISLGLNLVEIGQALENFSLPFGRMNLMQGIKNTHIIDDSYNASLLSTTSALETLSNIKAKRKIAVLGDMLELGSGSDAEHLAVVKKFSDINGDILITVGNRMKRAVEKLHNGNEKDKIIFSFANPMDAGKKLQDIMKKGDLILVKGSQGMRMEKVVEEVMAEPEHAAELLCRQDARWKNKPWREV